MLVFDSGTYNIPKQRMDAALSVDEALVQLLLKVDGLECHEGWEKVRLKRKEVVKLIQAHLDAIDGLKSLLKLKL